MQYLMYGPGGLITDTAKQIKNGTGLRFATLHDAFLHIKETYMFPMDIRDLAVSVYGYDERINKVVYLITWKGQGMQFLVDVSEC